MTAKEIEFRKAVYTHYRTNGRDLPWRRTRDPYHILVSEFMLQQTQVARVMDFYPKFIAQFPTLRALAHAPLSRVLRAWQGLGYNRRALHLKRTATVIMHTHRGRMPRNIQTLRALPGVGQSTAGAVCAFAFGIAEPFIETNIRRAFIHFFFPKKKKVRDEEILVYAKRTLSRKDPRTWYYALMDYGAALGTRKKNPNIKSAHYRTQPAFHGSTRELRGKILKLILAKKRISRTALAAHLGAEKNAVAHALAGLVRDNLARLRNTHVVLAD